MPEKRAYKEVLASVETHIVYIGNHLQNIDSHLDKINNHLNDHSSRITIVETLQKERNKPSKKSIAGWVSGLIAIVVALWRAFYNGG